MGIEISSSNADAHREMFRNYCEFNKRDNERLFVDEARKYATELWKVTAAVAPTKAQIQADIAKQGWKIPTRFADGRLGRGVAKNWLGNAWDTIQKSKKRRGRRTKQSHLDEADFMAQKPTLAMMQAFVLKYRLAARLFTASGWLPAVLRFGGSPKGSSGFTGPKHGSASLTRTDGRLTYTFVNSTPGIAGQDAKHNLVATAKRNRILDMQKYIYRKIGEGLVMLRRAA